MQCDGNNMLTPCNNNSNNDNNIAAYVMHSLLLGSNASRSLPCLASQEARVDVDVTSLAQVARRRHHDNTLDSIFGVAA